MSDRILALDVGASKLALAEFTLKGNAPVLTKYAFEELPYDVDHDAEHLSAEFVQKLAALVRANGFKPAPLYLTLSGQSVFPRFTKLPPVDEGKLGDMIQMEAEQNIPFPLNEVIWDYCQLKGDPGDLEVSLLLMAAKSEVVGKVTSDIMKAGLIPELIDASTLALYNAARFNYPDADGCTMVLDMGAKATSLVFIEGDKLFTRSITTAGQAITQEIARTLNVTFQEAEKMKCDIGFVALGGTYALTDDPQADRVSKVIRSVATRLHAEINRSVNFYRSQQGGSVPKRVLLTGRTAFLPQMDTFIREKMQVEVSYLNPFVNIAVGCPVAEGDAASLMQLSGVVGLALRRAATCPVEINLLPADLASRKAFLSRLPYFAIAAAGLIAASCCWYQYTHKATQNYEAQKEQVETDVKRLDGLKSQIVALKNQQKELSDKIRVFEILGANRNDTARVFELVRSKIIPGMWLTKIIPERSGEMRDDEAGFDRVRLEGLAYDERLCEKYEDGNDAIAKFYQSLVGDGSVFKASEDCGVKGTSLRHKRIIREFTVLLQLRAPMGDPTRERVAGDDTENGSEG